MGIILKYTLKQIFCNLLVCLNNFVCTEKKTLQKNRNLGIILKEPLKQIFYLLVYLIVGKYSTIARNTTTTITITNCA